MLDAAVHWLELGLGLDRAVIVAHSDASAEAAARVFEAARGAYTAPALPAAPPADFDLFISYSHANTQIADALVRILRDLRPGVRVFVDRHELDAGMAWQEAIFEGLERSRRVVALLSPAYLASKACKEEFGIARLHGNRTGARSCCRSTCSLPTCRRTWRTSSTSTRARATRRGSARRQPRSLQRSTQPWARRGARATDDDPLA